MRTRSLLNPLLGLATALNLALTVVYAQNTSDSRQSESENSRRDDGGRGERGRRGERGGYRNGGERNGDERNGDRRGEEKRNDSGDRGAGVAPARAEAGSAKSGGRTGVARYGSARNRKSPASLTLPSQYIAKDGNKDGQIGLYEWSQNDLSTFRKLDLNGDGFLVPSEFAIPGTRPSASTTVAPSITSSGTTPQSSQVQTSVGDSARQDSSKSESARYERRPYGNRDATGQSNSKSGDSSSTPTSADPLVAEGETAFGLRDLDKDGQLNQEEFDGSVRIKRVFEKAKMQFVGPVPKAKFLELYRQALLAKEAQSME